jgi:hypothetical protein
MTVTPKINGDHFKERRETGDLVQPEPVVEGVGVDQQQREILRLKSRNKF